MSNLKRTLPWNPKQYLKFSAERFLPFEDLVNLIDFDRLKGEMSPPSPPAIVRGDCADAVLAGEGKTGLESPDQVRGRLCPAVVDLGCGTGELTLKLAAMLPGAKVEGIDSSKEMLDKAEIRDDDERSRVRFKLQSIEVFAEAADSEIQPARQFDLIFSNAALHWVDDHPRLLRNLWKRLKPGGQIAVQVPSGVRNKAQLAVMEIGVKYLKIINDVGDSGPEWKFPVLPVDHYAEILYRLGAEDIVAFEKVYPHILKDGEAVYEWVAGTTMNAYLKRITNYGLLMENERDGLVGEFKKEVKAEVVRRYPGSPVIFPFRRIFFTGRKKLE